uniref:Uncharacterized protein n=1 Tax=Helianthus annuus TaxID=4232 RepID=A0A251T5J4_HELAN
MASGRLGPTTSSSGNLSTLFHFQLNFARPSILRPFGFVTGCRFGFRDWPTAVVVPTVVTPTVHSGQTWVHFTRFGSGPASIRVSSFGQLSWFESRFSRSRTKDRPEILLILFGLAEVNCNHRSLSTSPELCQTTRSEAEFTTELESTSFRGDADRGCLELCSVRVLVQVHSGQTWVHFTRFGSGPASIRVSSFGQLSWFESRFSRSRTKDRPEILLILFGLAEVNCNHRSLSTSPELCQTTRSEAEFTTELESTSFRLIDVILLDSSNLYPCVFEEIANATNVDDDEMKTDSKDA